MEVPGRWRRALRGADLGVFGPWQQGLEPEPVRIMAWIFSIRSLLDDEGFRDEGCMQMSG